MSQTLVAAIGALVAILWGLAHIFATSLVVKGFGALSGDNRLIITMEWGAEGLALIFVGVLPLLVLFLSPHGETSRILVLRACSAMLVVMAAWTAATGSRTSSVPVKICPIIKSLAAGLILLGSFS